MLSFLQYISEEIKYKPFKPRKMARDEHDEVRTQNQAVRSGDLKVHPQIAQALKRFGNPREFARALRRSTIKSLAAGIDIANTDFSGSTQGLDPEKTQRVNKQLKTTGIDRPIVLKHGEHYHLLAGNTRATTVGPGVQAHVIRV
jgi:hypothetical protein